MSKRTLHASLLSDWKRRACLGLLLPALLAASAAAAQRAPLPLDKDVTLREDHAIWYVEGRQRIKSSVKITNLRACTIAAAGEGAVLEVEGALDVRAATGGEVVFDGVWIEPVPGCKGLTLLNARFEGDSGLRTSEQGAVDTEVILSSSKFKGRSRLELGMSGGKLAVMKCGFDGPAKILGITTEKQPRNMLELMVVGCTGKELGFFGGLRIEGVREVLVRNSDLSGPECVLSDCDKLEFDGNRARSKRIEIRHSAPKSFGGTTLSNTDFSCKELVLFQPAIAGEAQRLRLERCWFDGRTEPADVKANMLSDSERDPECGVLATFLKIQEAPLGLAGS